MFSRIHHCLRDSALAHALRRRRRNQVADVFLISYPKCGRTWLRMLLGKALTLHFGLPTPDSALLELDRLAPGNPRVPRIKATHDDNPQYRRPSELLTVKSEYRDRKIIFLVRDLRDLVVSVYFQLNKRSDRRFSGNITAFLNQDRGSVAAMVGFYNIWARNRQVPAGFLLVRYEDLHRDPHGQLRRALEFIGVDGVSDAVIALAVEFSRFDNMRKLETTQSINRLTPGNKADPESFKTRKGKVGGYREYLTAAQIAEIERAMREDLDPMFGYPVQAR